MSNLTQEEIEAMLRGENLGGSDSSDGDTATEAPADGGEPSAAAPADESGGAGGLGASMYESGGQEWFDPNMAGNEKLKALDLSDQYLSEVEKDTLGEIGNICMGASATTMYTLLGHKVEITTPMVRVYQTERVLDGYTSPFVVVDVEYVEGISGKNLLVMRDYDAAIITDLLMGGTGEVPEGEFEINEIHLSAMSEVMNQMIGASATSLSNMLNRLVNISPPQASLAIEKVDMKHILDTDVVVCIAFDMQIEGLLRTNLMQIMSLDVAKELVKTLAGAGAEPEPEPAPAPAPAPPAPAPAPAAPPMDDPFARSSQQQVTVDPFAQSAAQYQQPMPQQYQQPAAQQAPGQQYQQPMGQQMPPQQYQQPMYQQPMYQQYQQPVQTVAPIPQPSYDVSPMSYPSFEVDPAYQVPGRDIEIVSDIPLQVSVELGRTKKNVDDVLHFGVGSIVVLDKLAGELVDVIVNGKTVARGEVVVIDENYGVRITDILRKGV